MVSPLMTFVVYALAVISFVTVIARAYIWWTTRPLKEMVVTGLYIYPVKSCAGIELQQSEFDRLGFLHDRRFVVVHAQSGNMVSQREYPQMALILPEIHSAAGTMTLSFPDEAEVLTLPLHPKADELDTKEAPVTVWDDTIQARVFTAPHIEAWLRRVLRVKEGCTLRLASTLGAKEHHRPMQPTFDRSPALEVQPGFGDQSPFLLTTEESLRAVNMWTVPNGRVVTMDCFRPNIVVRGSNRPWAEDYWRRVKIGPATLPGGKDADSEGDDRSTDFWVAKAAPRCILTTVIPEEGRFHPTGEPLVSLRAHRQVLEHIPSQAGGAFFGQHLMPATRAHGRVRVGDRVTLVESRVHMFDPCREKVQPRDKEAVEAQDREAEQKTSKPDVDACADKDAKAKNSKHE